MVAVKDEFGTSVPGATVMAKWTMPNGTTQTKSATTAANGSATLLVTGARGTYKFTVTNITKAGYTFDPAHSILTKSITK